MQLATQTITKIAEITEDKTMYDAREKAMRDRQWALNQAHREGEIDGEIKGEIKLIRTLEGILGLVLSKEEDLQNRCSVAFPSQRNCLSPTHSPS